jgi:site-specific DNA-cytosine methylase
MRTFVIIDLFCGAQDQQKKFIGNAVVPEVVKAWAERYFMAVNGHAHQSDQLQMVFAHG